MIAKLEKTQSHAQQTETNTEPPGPMGSTPNNRTTALERTAA